MHFTASTFVASLALLSQLAIALPSPQVTITRVVTHTLQAGETPPPQVQVNNKMAVDDSPQRHRKHFRLHKVQKNPTGNSQPDNNNDDSWRNRGPDSTTSDNEQEDTAEDNDVEQPFKDFIDQKNVDATLEEPEEEAVVVDKPVNESKDSKDEHEPTNNDSEQEDTDDEETTESSSGGAGPSDSMMKEILDIHNQWRKDHGADPLVWDEALASHAELDEGRIACPSKKGSLTVGEHSDDKSFDCGENLSATTGKISADSVKGWYEEEVGKYNFNNGGFSMETGHFSQVVWKATTKLGCAVGCGETRLRCQYQEPGNFGGRYQENVCPKGGC